MGRSFAAVNGGSARRTQRHRNSGRMSQNKRQINQNFTGRKIGFTACQQTDNKC